jgi:hypothetical protein
LKQKCDEPLSNGAFNFNLRRFTSATNYGRADKRGGNYGTLNSDGRVVHVEDLGFRV